MEGRGQHSSQCETCVKFVHQHIGQHFPLEARDPVHRFSSGFSGIPVWTLRLVARSCTPVGSEALASSMPRKRVRSFCFSVTTSSGRRVHTLYAQFLRSSFCGLEVSSRTSVLLLCGTATFFCTPLLGQSVGFSSSASFAVPTSLDADAWEQRSIAPSFASHHAGHRVLHDCGTAFFSLSFVARHLF